MNTHTTNEGGQRKTSKNNRYFVFHVDQRQIIEDRAINEMQWLYKRVHSQNLKKPFEVTAMLENNSKRGPFDLLGSRHPYHRVERYCKVHHLSQIWRPGKEGISLYLSLAS